MTHAATASLLRGRVQQISELRMTQDGEAVTTLALAVDDGRHARCTITRAQADHACISLAPGDVILATGQITAVRSDQLIDFDVIDVAPSLLETRAAVMALEPIDTPV